MCKRYCTPKKRAMSMKFSPPTMLFAKRMATVVPYATCTHNHTSFGLHSLNRSPRLHCNQTRMHWDTWRALEGRTRSVCRRATCACEGSSVQCRQQLAAGHTCGMRRAIVMSTSRSSPNTAW